MNNVFVVHISDGKVIGFSSTIEDVRVVILDEDAEDKRFLFEDWGKPDRIGINGPMAQDIIEQLGDEE